TRPPHWTQAHHIIPWTHGGPTDMNNLILLCGFHHHRVHDEGWTLQLDGRELTIRRPDGTILDPPD
ncbi:HNH endonuclease signature motif containing protein, partial [Cryptosporangium aurantiacum]